MAGTYFDFSNTPITSDTTLKAKWCGCGGSEAPTFPFTGDYFRVTLTDGTKWVAPADKIAAYMFVDSRGGRTETLVAEDGISTQVVGSYQVAEIEFGKGWEHCTNQYICCFSSQNRWDALVKVSGYPEGLGAALTPSAFNDKLQIGYGLAGQTNARPVEINLRLPATYAAAAYANTHGLANNGARYSKLYVYGKIYFDYSPSDVNRNGTDWGTQFECDASNYNGCNNGDCIPADYATWHKGWGFGGPYAKEWLNQYQPITNCSTPTKCVLRNTYIF